MMVKNSNSMHSMRGIMYENLSL